MTPTSTTGWWLRCGSTALLAAATLLAGCERPPINSVQRGYRGTGMEQVFNPRIQAEQAALNTPPADTPMVPPGGPPASAVFKNVQVVGDLSVGEFSRLMVSMTSWVSPQQGCTYCHRPGEDFSSDSLYTKVVARRMLQMTRYINSSWKTHVADTGVTCYTCHRGQNVPPQTWYAPAVDQHADRMVGTRAGQNAPAGSVGYASLPNDPFTAYLDQANDVRVVGTTALATTNRHSTKQAEFSYGLMMHMSQALGVNCTYCHNSRSFAEWDTSTPQRGTAWYGIRLARDVNTQYIKPLAGTLPANRLGPTGDVPKVNCTTCHQGAFKPLYGARMLDTHPELAGVRATVVAGGGLPSAADAASAPIPGVAVGSATNLVTGSPQDAASGLVTVPSAAGASGPAPTVPAAAASGSQAVLLFAVGSAALTPDAAGGLAPLIAALKANPSSQIVVSGYHSASGNFAQNQELAKQRAFAVRDALQAAGIAASRVKLDKPQQTEANVAGEDPKARRVEVAVR